MNTSPNASPTFTDNCAWVIRVDGGRERRAWITKSIGGWSVEYFTVVPMFIAADNPRITWVSKITV